MKFHEFCGFYLHQRDYVEKFLLENCRPLAQRAYEFAKERHSGQGRLDGTPYITHLIEVAYYHIIMGFDDDETLAECFLHDGIEDKKMTLEEILENFTKTIARRVLTMTKDNNLSREMLEVYFDEIFKEIETIIRKIIDRVANVKRSMIGFFSKEKLQKYCWETDMLISRLEGFIAIIEDSGIGNHYYERYHHYARQLRVLRGFLKGFIQAAEEHLKLMEENEYLRQPWFKKWIKDLKIIWQKV